MVHFAGHMGGATVFTLPGVEAIQDIGSRGGPHDVRHDIDCRMKNRELVKMLQREDLHSSLLATCYVDTIGKSPVHLQMLGYLIDRPAQLTGERLE